MAVFKFYYLRVLQLNVEKHPFNHSFIIDERRNETLMTNLIRGFAKFAPEKIK